MQPLVEDVHHLRREAFGYSRELLNRSPRNGQRSSTLLITCADAWLLAERITETNPDGFCFASGLGSVVPPASTVAAGDADSLAVTIEYAVRVLRVGNIVVCGHSPCGAMATLIRGSFPRSSQPNLAWWLKRVAPIRDLVRSRYAPLTGEAECRQASELESVLISLENLPTYPCVRERLDQSALHLHGWSFKTATGELLAYNPAAGQFELLMTFAEGRGV